MKTTKQTLQYCPSCHSDNLTSFFEVSAIPVHSVLLMRTREQAQHFQTGDLELTFCTSCGFIFNRAFDGQLQHYSEEYEETQGFSPTFNKFHKQLALYLIDAYGLKNKDIIEIGCGKGEFLTLLCELGNNRGVGFDPAYIEERNKSSVKDNITFVTDLYSEKYSDYKGDFICCKMTLEHIIDTGDFIATVRRSIGDNKDVIVFFQIPEARRVLRDMAFWDIYYEHCSYFSKGSLARLFRSQGFDVNKLWTDYDDQYLMIEAQPCVDRASSPLQEEDDLDALKEDVVYFTDNICKRLDTWRTMLREYATRGQKVILWGGGSKAVAFLTTLGITDEVAYTVDINPFKHGTFLAGTGQEIISPLFLKEYQPDTVIIMNPIYRDEIQKDLQEMGLSPELLDIDQF